MASGAPCPPAPEAAWLWSEAFSAEPSGDQLAARPVIAGDMYNDDAGFRQRFQVVIYYTILYDTILYYTILYYTILYYTILYYTILY